MKISFLSFIPFPLPDESPISAIQRTAKENGFKNCHALLTWLNKATHQSPYGNFLLANSAISKTLQVCAPKYAKHIIANFYQPTHPLIKRSNAIIKGIEITYSNLRCEGSALCTQCLKEGYEKFPKDISFFMSCPFHNRAFLFCCPTCGTKIKWKVQLTNRCECGHYLVSPNLPNSEMTPDQHLLQLFRLGNAEKIASIQRNLATLEHETFADEDAMKTARRNLAIAISCEDVDGMKDAIHAFLPSSSAEEIDVILAIFANEIKSTTAATLRQKLISTTSEQNAHVAKITLSLGKLLVYIGISQSAWYKLKHRHSFFKGIGRRAQISLKDAINLKKVMASENKLDNDLHQRKLDSGYKQIFSLAAASFLTGIPESTIKVLALNTNLLGPKTRYIKLAEKGLELRFGRTNIEFFNQHYVCSQRLAREWNTPASVINSTILKHKFHVEKSNFSEGTVIIKKTLSFRLSTIINERQSRHAPERRKRLDVPRVEMQDTSNFLTCVECAKLLSISTSEINYLIREQLISCQFRGSRGRYLISKEEVLNFNKKYVRIYELSEKLNTSPQQVSHLLSAAGIMPISGPLVNSGRVLIYNKITLPDTTINSLKNRPSAITRPLRHNITDISEPEYCINTNSICERFSISKSLFYRKFLATGLARFKTFKSARYITKKDSATVCNILQNYISYEEAERILNVPHGYIRHLVKKKKLIFNDVTFPLGKRLGLVPRDQLDEFRIQRAQVTITLL
jgi:hypothetical protein